MGHHAGISFEGWVNITGMVGQHKTEWWVNMLRNLQYINEFKFEYNKTPFKLQSKPKPGLATEASSLGIIQAIEVL